MDADCSQTDGSKASATISSNYKVEVKTDIMADKGCSDVPTDAMDKLERNDFKQETLVDEYSGFIIDTDQLNCLSKVLDEKLSNPNNSEEIETNCDLPSDFKLSNSSNSSSSCSEDNSKILDEDTLNRISLNTDKMYTRKKNHLFVLNTVLPKLTKPENIPKFKLYERNDNISSVLNEDYKFEKDNDKFDVDDEDINDKDFNLSASLNECSNSSNNIQGTSIKHNVLLNSTIVSDALSNVILSQRMRFPDIFEDSEEEEETKCTCIPNIEMTMSEEEDHISNCRSGSDEGKSFNFSDSEMLLFDDTLKPSRKRKNNSPNHSIIKKYHSDVTVDLRNVPENPPDIRNWLGRFSSWSGSERLQAIDLLISRCAADQVRHMMQAIEPLFQRDFISLLPRELALSVLGYLEPKDLLRAAQTCRYWRFLADDNLLWKEQCQRVGILSLRKRLRSMPCTASPWKAAYMRQHIIEHNWLSKPTNTAKILKGHDDHVITCLQFYGNKILSGSDDTTLKVWSAATGKCLRTLVGHTGGVWSSQMIGRTIISGSTDRTLRVWDACSGSCLRTLSGHTSTVRCMHLHYDRVVSGSRDATLRIWSVPDGKCLRVLVGHLAAVRCVQYNGRLVVSGAYDYFVKVWNPDSAECLHTLSGHTNRVYSLQFDGVHVVSGSLDTSIMVWDVESGALKHTLMGHQSLTSGMELRKNILVSGNADSTVKVWDILTGQCLHTLSGPNKHQSAVTCLQSNSRFVITSSDDGTVKLWDVKTGEFIRNLISLGSGGSGGVVWRIRASSTKLVCAVGSRNGTEETKLMVLDFDVPGACLKCDE